MKDIHVQFCWIYLHGLRAVFVLLHVCQSDVFQPISTSFFNCDVDVTAPDVAAQRVKLVRTKHKPTLFSDDVARCLASNARNFTGLNENANNPLYTSLNLYLPQASIVRA